MADLLNLRRFRKAQQRSEKEVLASRNRVEFGRSKQERAASAASAEKAAQVLDAHRRDVPVPATSHPNASDE